MRRIAFFVGLVAMLLLLAAGEGRGQQSTLGGGGTAARPPGVLYVATNGVDATAAINSSNSPYLTPLAACRAALPGDTISIGRGFYNISNTLICPVNGMIVGCSGGPGISGQGLGLTVLSNWIASASGPCVQPSDGCTISDLRIIDGDPGVSGFRLPFGINSVLYGARAFKATRINILGWTDAIEFQTTNTCSGSFEDCILKGSWDLIIISDDLRSQPCHSFDFYNCTWASTNYGRAGAANAIGVLSHGATINVYGGSMNLANNYTTISCGDYADNIISNSTVNVYGCSIVTLGSQPTVNSDVAENCYVRFYGMKSGMSAANETSFGVTNIPFFNTYYGSNIDLVGTITGNGSGLTNVATATMSGTTGNTVLVAATTYFFQPHNSSATLPVADVSGGTREMVTKTTTFGNLYCKLSADPGSAKTYIFTLMTNGVASSITATVTGNGTTGTTANDTTHTEIVLAGTEVGVKIVTLAAATGVKASWAFQAK